jgi:dihydroorotate dehydrogenase electron transfer subunit
MTVNTSFPITRHYRVAEQTYCIRFRSPELASEIKPGQFFNVRVDDSFEPFLRRPYSISNVYGDECEFMFTIAGRGTSILAQKSEGDAIDIVGPLGNHFGYDKDFTHAIILAGGIGVAPFPYLTTELKRLGKNISTILGARSEGFLVDQGLDNVHVATDDGSRGYHGNVVQCLNDLKTPAFVENAMLFACGPNPMLKAVQGYAAEHGLLCELSLESEMACGMGICQGCPIEHTESSRTYGLVCTDGPCFDSRVIVFNQNSHA